MHLFQTHRLVRYWKILKSILNLLHREIDIYVYTAYHIVLIVFHCIIVCALVVTDTDSKTKPSNDECLDEQSDVQRQIEEQVKTTTQSEEHQVSFNMSSKCPKAKEKLSCEQQNGHLMKEVRSGLTLSVNSLHSFFFSAKPPNQLWHTGTNRHKLNNTNLPGA